MTTSRLRKGKTKSCSGDFNKNSVNRRKICEKRSEICNYSRPLPDFCDALGISAWLSYAAKVAGATRTPKHGRRVCYALAFWSAAVHRRFLKILDGEKTSMRRSMSKSKIPQHRGYNFRSCDIFLQCKRLKSPLI